MDLESFEKSFFFLLWVPGFRIKRETKGKPTKVPTKEETELYVS